jgi:hypothetical protein
VLSRSMLLWDVDVVAGIGEDHDGFSFSRLSITSDPQSLNVDHEFLPVPAAIFSLYATIASSSFFRSQDGASFLCGSSFSSRPDDPVWRAATERGVRATGLKEY